MPVSTISPARFGYTGQLCLLSVVTTNFLRRKHSSPQRGPRLPHNTTHAFVVHRPTAPLLLGILQASPQKIVLHGLAADLPLQFGDPAFLRPHLAMAGKRLDSVLVQLAFPAM